MSISIQNVGTIVKNCFNLPAAVASEYEELIGKFMLKKEYAAGHRGRAPSDNLLAKNFGRTGRSQEIQRDIMSYLGTVKHASMHQIGHMSTASHENTRQAVSNLITDGRVSKYRDGERGQAIYLFSAVE